MLKLVMPAVLSLCLLTGCKDEMSFSYLFQHPDVLNKIISQCQVASDKPQTPECERAMYAAANSMVAMAELQSNPEKFGERILDDQMKTVTLEQTLQTAKAHLQQLKAKSSSEAEIQAAQKAVDEAKEAIKQNEIELSLLLATVSNLTSPG